MTQGEYAAIYEITYPRARHDYSCDACREPIPKDTRYSSHRSLYDGHWSVVRQCARCALHWQALRDDPERNDEYGWWPAPELDCGDAVEDTDEDAELMAKIWEILVMTDAAASAALMEVECRRSQKTF